MPFDAALDVDHKKKWQLVEGGRDSIDTRISDEERGAVWENVL